MHNTARLHFQFALSWLVLFAAVSASSSLGAVALKRPERGLQLGLKVGAWLRFLKRYIHESEQHTTNSIKYLY